MTNNKASLLYLSHEYTLSTEFRQIKYRSVKTPVSTDENLASHSSTSQSPIPTTAPIALPNLKRLTIAEITPESVALPQTLIQSHRSY